MTDDPTPKLHAQVWRDTTGEWRYRIRAGNGEIIASGEGYERRASAVHALRLLGLESTDITVTDGAA